jgi:type II restriction enzyme
MKKPDSQNSIAHARRLEETVALVERLSPIQLHVVRAIIERFANGFTGKHLIDSFLSAEAYEYFGMRLTAHHAYSSNLLKKENFEHILEQSFKLAGIPASRQNSMTHRGADLMVGNRSVSLKTESALGLRADKITISKLMEAAWIKRIRQREDIPAFIHSMVLPHFENYQSIFMLRSYMVPQLVPAVRYDLHEIPKELFEQVATLKAEDFSLLTATRTTSASVKWKGENAFKFRLDGSDDKLTITNLDVKLCPLHAWWSLDLHVR